MAFSHGCLATLHIAGRDVSRYLKAIRLVRNAEGGWQFSAKGFYDQDLAEWLVGLAPHLYLEYQTHGNTPGSGPAFYIRGDVQFKVESNCKSLTTFNVTIEDAVVSVLRDPRCKD